MKSFQIGILHYQSIKLLIHDRIYIGKVREGLTEENVKEYFESNYACKCETVELIREKKDSVAEGEEPKLR